MSLFGLLNLTDNGALQAAPPEQFAGVPAAPAPPLPSAPMAQYQQPPAPPQAPDAQPDQNPNTPEAVFAQMRQMAAARDKRLKEIQENAQKLDAWVSDQMQPDALQRALPQPTATQMLKDALYNFGQYQLRNKYTGNPNLGDVEPIQQTRLKQALQQQSQRLNAANQARQVMGTEMQGLNAQASDQRLMESTIMRHQEYQQALAQKQQALDEKAKRDAVLNDYTQSMIDLRGKQSLTQEEAARKQQIANQFHEKYGLGTNALMRYAQEHPDDPNATENFMKLQEALKLEGDLAKIKVSGAVKASAAASAATARTSAALDPAGEQLADAIAHYRIAPISGFALSKPENRAAMARAVEINPAYRGINYNSYQRMENDAAVGKIGTAANALNTMIGHLGVLNDASDALGAGDIQKLNSLAQFIGVQTGASPVTTYETIVHRLGPEVTKAYLSAGGTLMERGTNESDFAAKLAPAQRKANIGISALLADSKIKALQDQYTRGTYGMGEQKLISDESEAVRQRLVQQSPVKDTSGVRPASRVVAGPPASGPPIPPAQDAKPAPIVQRKLVNGQYQYRRSNDGGKTWQPGQ